ncbi:MAG: alpha/beta hydrolase [Armatimonadetes bacterium]|nr:alpha/beta hydrolase [Armatimonadota bacterium]
MLAGSPASVAAEPTPIPLWPGIAPGEKGDRGVEQDTTKHDPNAKPGTEVIRLGHVSTPTLTVYRPAADKANGAAIVVCPGGGYNILAWDLEGTEICAWLNSIGVTGLLLKYRVPGHLSDTYRAPLQDAQRALSLARANAAAWGLDAKRVGILGFSAGGHLSAATSNATARSYDAVDDADKTSCRPDFSVLVYPAYLTDGKDLSKLSPALAVTKDTPPAFIVQAQDDPIPVENSLRYAEALQAVKVPVELHIYPKGGHGYGMRPSANPVCHWPDRVAEWLAASGWLKTR